MTTAKANFDKHICQCSDANEIYRFLKSQGYSADFGLRFVWVAAVSALDHYVTELIVEKVTEHFVNGEPLRSKALNEGIPISALMNIAKATPAEAALHFRKAITDAVRFRTFQKARDVADGLSFVWEEQHKWDKIAAPLGLSPKSAKAKLNSISSRRDRIVHNADYDEASGLLTACVAEDACDASAYIVSVVETIDALVP